MTRTAPAPAIPHATVGVAVDVVPFAIVDGVLHAALVPAQSAGRRRLAFPGGRVREHESLDEAAERFLSAYLPGHGAYVEQLYTFGEPGRDAAARVVSVAYFALLSEARPAPDVRWLPATELPPLAYDHGTIALVAVERLRAKLAYTNLAYALLPPTFTLAELQEVYEAVLGRRLDRRNFRKRILALGLLTPLGEARRGPHRPARLYRFTERRPATISVLSERAG